MALSSMQRSLCQKAYSSFDPLINPAYKASTGMRSSVNQVTSLLRNLSGNFSPDDLIYRSINDLRYQSGMYIPGYGQSDLYSMLDFMRQCLFYDGKNPYSVLNSLLSQAYQGIDNAMSMLGNDVPEFDIGSMIGNLLNKYLGLNLTDVLKQADRILNCLAALCGSEYYVATWKMSSTLNNLFVKTNAVSDPLSPYYGTFDYETLYSNAGILPNEITKMNNVMNAYTDIRTEASTSITNAFTTLKGIL
jgi:hypothetical protein